MGKRKVYCSCRQPSHGFMISCDVCKEWFHGTCVRVTQTGLDDSLPWYCPMCDVRRRIDLNTASIQVATEQVQQLSVENVNLQNQIEILKTREGGEAAGAQEQENMKLREIEKLQELSEENIKLKNEVQKLQELSEENIKLKNEVQKLQELSEENIKLKNEVQKLQELCHTLKKRKKLTLSQ